MVLNWKRKVKIIKAISTLPYSLVVSNSVDSLGVLESVKAAADIYTPVGGTVAEVNSALEEDPDLVNQDPYNKGK